MCMHYPMITQESQFDAVILGDGDFPTSAEAVAALRNATYLCCCDGAGAKAIEHNLKPNAIVGDGDSLPKDFKERHASIIHTVSEQDDNDLTKATRHCMALGYRHIAYLGATGKREDHTLGNISLMARYMHELGLRPTMITNHGYFTPCQGNTVFDTRPGQQVSIVNLTCNNISSNGLKWPAYTYRQWWQGTLNEAVSAQIEFKADGIYLVYICFEMKQ